MFLVIESFSCRLVNWFNRSLESLVLIVQFLETSFLPLWHHLIDSSLGRNLIMMANPWSIFFNKTTNHIINWLAELKLLCVKLRVKTSQSSTHKHQLVNCPTHNPLDILVGDGEDVQ